MEAYKLILALALGAIIYGCGDTQKKSDRSEGDEQATTIDEKSEKSTMDTEVDLRSLIKSIDNTRDAIEKHTGDPIVMTTESLREKIKQKWEKIHFYTIEGQLVRVKTYPHATITDRTEEFYLDNEELILVVIEDNGLGDRGKSKDQLDRLYYFQNGELVMEQNRENDPEYTMRASDAEELLTELMEYMEIYANYQGK